MTTMSLFESFVSYIGQEVALSFSGLLSGVILGGVYGYTKDNTRKQKTILVFGAILIAAIGGGLYLHSLSNQLDTFTIFTIFLSLGFISAALIARKIHNKRYRPFVGVFSLGWNPQLDEWRQKFGPGFISEDELIVEAIRKGKRTHEEIATYTNLEKKLIKDRVEFMKKKGLFGPIK